MARFRFAAARRFVVALALAAAMAFFPVPPAAARTSAMLSYPIADVWPTAVRFLRVDRNAVLREKDAETGYVLFDLPEANRMWKGALELVRTVDAEGRQATRAVVTLPDLPRHHEATLLEKLAVKVREEHGSPAPPPPKRAPDARKPDAGVDEQARPGARP